MTRTHLNHTVAIVSGILLLSAVAMGAVFVSSVTAQDTTIESSTTTTQDHDIGSNNTSTASAMQTSSESDIKISFKDSTNGQDSANVSVTVVENNTSNNVPPELEEDVTATQYSAVLDGNNELQASNLSNAINQWADSGSVDGVDISASVLSALINFWASN